LDFSLSLLGQPKESTVLTILFHSCWFFLQRVWGPSPTVGAGVAELSRDYFFTLALLVYAIILAYFYSGFPFDNVCDTGSTVTSDYVGTFSAVTSDDAATAVEITIGSDESLYQYCLQDLLRYASNGLGTAFPAIPSYQPEGHEWMTSGQETGSSLLGWSSVAVLIITVMIIVNRSVFAILRNFFLKPKIDQGGKLSEQRFSEGKETTAYIPQVKSTVSDLPFLACDISHLNESLLDFENPMINFPFDSTNLIYDLPELNEGDKKLFSLVNHWPPKKTIHH